MNDILVFSMGLFFGLGFSALILYIRRQDLKAQAQDSQIIKASIESISEKTLSQSIERLLKINEQQQKQLNESQNKDLQQQKGLIDQSLIQIKQELDMVHKTMNTLEKDREQKFGELSETLKNANTHVGHLLQSTQALSQALRSSHSRGQWGERMAEDVLKFSGLLEGINYVKQSVYSDSDLTRNIPDFTFFLPNNLKVNMDVKFPFSHYLDFINSDSEILKDTHKKAFFKDVKARIKEVTTRSYISEDTVDYVLVFIPNEQVYGFINQEDQEIIQDALSKKVVLCSPLTLYAILSTIRQSIDNFHMDQRATEILVLLNKFHDQWDKFKESLFKMGSRLESTLKEFEHLSTTRFKQLEKPLSDIEALKSDGKTPALKEEKLSRLEIKMGDDYELKKWVLVAPSVKRSGGPREHPAKAPMIAVQIYTPNIPKT